MDARELMTIADNITIGVNAVVTKSFTEPGIVIAGAPARKIRNKNMESDEVMQ